MDSLKYSNQTKKLCGTKNGSITPDLLDVFLYGKRKIQGIDLDNAKRQKIGQGKCVKPLKCEWSIFMICKHISTRIYKCPAFMFAEQRTIEYY